MSQYAKELLALIDAVNREMVRLRTAPEADRVVVEISGDHFWLALRASVPGGRRGGYDGDMDSVTIRREVEAVALDETAPREARVAAARMWLRWRVRIAGAAEATEAQALLDDLAGTEAAQALALVRTARQIELRRGR